MVDLVRRYILEDLLFIVTYISFQNIRAMLLAPGLKCVYGSLYLLCFATI